MKNILTSARQKRREIEVESKEESAAVEEEGRGATREDEEPPSNISSGSVLSPARRGGASKWPGAWYLVGRWRVC